MSQPLALSHHQEDACPVAEVTGPSSVFLTHKYAGTSFNGMRKGCTYYMVFTAPNCAAFSCGGMVKACVPFEGQPDCTVTA